MQRENPECAHDKTSDDDGDVHELSSDASTVLLGVARQTESPVFRDTSVADEPRRKMEFDML